MFFQCPKKFKQQKQNLISRYLTFSSMFEQTRQVFLFLKNGSSPPTLPSFKRYSELIRNDLVFENIAPISFRFDLKREWGKILPCRQDLIDLKSLVLNCHQEKWMHDGDKEWHFTQQRYAHNTIKQYTSGGVKKTIPYSRAASIL